MREMRLTHPMCTHTKPRFVVLLVPLFLVTRALGPCFLMGTRLLLARCGQETGSVFFPVDLYYHTRP